MPHLVRDIPVIHVLVHSVRTTLSACWTVVGMHHDSLLHCACNAQPSSLLCVFFLLLLQFLSFSLPPLLLPLWLSPLILCSAAFSLYSSPPVSFLNLHVITVGHSFPNRTISLTQNSQSFADTVDTRGCGLQLAKECVKVPKHLSAIMPTVISSIHSPAAIIADCITLHPILGKSRE